MSVSYPATAEFIKFHNDFREPGCTRIISTKQKGVTALAQGVTPLRTSDVRLRSRSDRQSTERHRDSSCSSRSSFWNKRNFALVQISQLEQGAWQFRNPPTRSSGDGKHQSLYWWPILKLHWFAVFHRGR